MKSAIMLCVSSKSWKMQKYILMETDDTTDRISDIAKRTFEKYKNTQNEDINLIDYSYYGDVEILN